MKTSLQNGCFPMNLHILPTCISPPPRSPTLPPLCTMKPSVGSMTHGERLCEGIPLTVLICNYWTISIYVFLTVFLSDWNKYPKELENLPSYCVFFGEVNFCAFPKLTPPPELTLFWESYPSWARHLLARAETKLYETEVCVMDIYWSPGTGLGYCSRSTL